MKAYRTALVAAIMIAVVSPARAWWDEGHMQIAAMAYHKLTDKARQRVDELLKLNPEYGGWVLGVPTADAPITAALRAAVWADDIKSNPDYSDDDAGADAENSGAKIGYQDKRKHTGWHYYDVFFSTDGTPLPLEEKGPSALTQIPVLAAALPAASGASEEARSYSLVWLIHLVGDVHQPLHAAARVTSAHPKGDQGGNLYTVKPANGTTLPLHAYWDGQLGGYSTTKGALFDLRQGKLEAEPVDEADAANLDVAAWIRESAAIAQQTAYASPADAPAPAELTRSYETAARSSARAQAALAARRLANLLNRSFAP